jgi:hypothetical protein
VQAQLLCIHPIPHLETGQTQAASGQVLNYIMKYKRMDGNTIGEL